MKKKKSKKENKVVEVTEEVIENANPVDLEVKETRIIKAVDPEDAIVDLEVPETIMLKTNDVKE